MKRFICLGLCGGMLLFAASTAEARGRRGCSSGCSTSSGSNGCNISRTTAPTVSLPAPVAPAAPTQPSKSDLQKAFEDGQKSAAPAPSEASEAHLNYEDAYRFCHSTTRDKTLIAFAR